MKKQLNQGVVIGILVIVGIVVIMLGWKAIAPPGPADIKPMTAAEVKVAQEKHAATVKEQVSLQQKLSQQSHGGGH